MSRTFRNQVLFANKNVEQARLSKSIHLDEFVIYFDENVPVIRGGIAILLGWAWDCTKGKKVTISELESIHRDSVIDDTKDFSGRYLLIIDERYVYSDTTSSYPLYYSENYASTNLSLHAEMVGSKTTYESEFMIPLQLPPSTGLENIKRLIPGEYYDLKDRKAISIQGFLSHDKQVISVEKRKMQVVDYLKTCAKGLMDIVGDDYRLMLTGGKDSRLSLLALYSVSGNNLKAFTHKKPHLLNDINDIVTPKTLSRILRFNHIFTYPKKNSFPEERSIFEHSKMLFGDMQPGSTFYYYLKSNWFQLREDYLIDNYYEIVRMHLHGKGIMGSADKINLNNIRKSGYIIDDDSYEYFSKHLSLINDGFDALDVFYFTKNFVNVANQFELIDYSHTPLIFCNSLHFFRSLLSVPETERKNGVFHMSLIESLTPEFVTLPECNKNSNMKIFKVMRIISMEIGKLRYKYLEAKLNIPRKTK